MNKDWRRMAECSKFLDKTGNNGDKDHRKPPPAVKRRPNGDRRSCRRRWTRSRRRETPPRSRRNLVWTSPDHRGRRHAHRLRATAAAPCPSPLFFWRCSRLECDFWWLPTGKRRAIQRLQRNHQQIAVLLFRSHSEFSWSAKSAHRRECRRGSRCCRARRLLFLPPTPSVRTIRRAHSIGPAYSVEEWRVKWETFSRWTWSRVFSSSTGITGMTCARVPQIEAIIISDIGRSFLASTFDSPGWRSRSAAP